MAEKLYPQVYDGEWVSVKKRGYKEQCCDCGKVHRVNYRVTADGTIQVQSFQDHRATAAVRRTFKFEKDDLA